MHVNTVIRLTNPAPIDFAAAGAAMRLAWLRTAQALWSSREFGTDHRALFAQQLREAHADVARTRRYQRKAELAAKHPRVIQLRAERDALYFQPLGMHVCPRIDQINAEISAITQGML